MQTTSESYKTAITARRRQIIPKVTFDLSDPDMTFGTVISTGENSLSNPKSLYDKTFDAPNRYATLEHNMWLLDGKSIVADDDKIGDVFAGNVLCDSACSIEFECTLNVSNLSVLQAASVHFPASDILGHAVDFVFSVYSGASELYVKIITKNTDADVYFDGFTLTDVTALKVTVTKWSLPYRYVRIVEIVPGIFEEWKGETVSSVDIIQQTDFTNLTTPYGSANLVIHNKNKRFNPYNKCGLFLSIEERQKVPIEYGIRLLNESFEYVPVGTFYQRNGGWETSAYGLTITFKLVDIIGLLANRKFVIPDTLPSTVDGWVSCVVSHLGDNFADRYKLDDGIASIALTASADNLENLNCGTVLRYIAMAIGGFLCTDPATGDLLIRYLPNAGGTEITLSNMNTYPKNEPVSGVASINFRLSNGTTYIVDGTDPAGDSLNVANPFLHTSSTADVVAANILMFYGINKYTIDWRGDMSCEIGDIDTFDTGFGEQSSGRRYKQQFKIDKVMKTAPSYLLEIKDVK